MWTWRVTYHYDNTVVEEEVQASNLSKCLQSLASKERLRPALIKRLTIVFKGETK